MISLFSRLFAPQLEPEVIDAYFHKLPDRVSVSWKRDEGFIVGEISFNGFDPIFTQARNPKEFVRMVNDAIFISLDFKSEYIDFLHRQKDIYTPTSQQWADLNDGSVMSSSFGLASNLHCAVAFA